MKNTDMFSWKRAMDVLFLCLFVCVEVYLTTLLLGRLSPLSG